MARNIEEKELMMARNIEEKELMMARYIKLDKAIEAIMDLPNCPNGYSDTYDKACIIGMLEEVPTADVVQVVRCKECKYFDRFDDEEVDWWCGIWANKTSEDCFCYWGERREDAEIH